MAKQDKKELDEIKKLLQEIERLYTKIGMANPFSGKEARDFLGNVSQLKDELDTANDILHDMDGGIGDLTNSWKALTDEVKSHYNTISRSKSSLSSLTSIAEKLKNHQKGIASLSAKELKSLQEQYGIQTESLETNQKALKQTIDNLSSKTNLTREELKQLTQSRSIYNTINGLLSENDSVHKLTNEKLKEEVKLTEDIEKKSGIIGGLLKGISKIPILGDSVDAKEALDEMEKSLRSGNGLMKSFGAGMGNIGNQIKNGLLNPMNLATAAVGLFIVALKNSDKAAGDLAKSMNITYEEALDVRRELGEMAAMSMDAALNTRALQESLIAVNQSLGTTGKISQGDLTTFTKLREQAGMTNEEILAMQKYSMATGGSLKDNVETFQATSKIMSYQKGVAINTKKLMADMANISNRTKISIEGGVTGLAKAAVAAKLMGSNLDQVAAISDQLLNFESSIENELSAELLLGKNINLEKARSAALNNDLATVASEITKQAGSLEEYQHMNRIQQEAMAKAVGMTADQLADVLVEQEAIKAVGGKLSDQEKEAYEAYKQKFGAEKAAKMLKEGQLDTMVKQQSIQERFNQSVEKLQEIFVNVSNAILPIVDAFSGIFNIVGPIAGVLGEIIGFVVDWGKYLLPIIAAYKTFEIASAAILAIKRASNVTDLISLGIAKSKIAQETILQALIIKESIARIIGNAWTSLGPIPFIGAALAAAAAAAGVGYLLSSTKGNDIMSPGDGTSGYGKRTLFGPEGAIQLNNKDTVIAGTNLFGDDVKSSPGKPTEMGKKDSIQIKSDSKSVDMAQTNALLQQLINVISTGGDVILDGQKVGQALKIGSFKTQ